MMRSEMRLTHSLGYECTSIPKLRVKPPRPLLLASTAILSLIQPLILPKSTEFTYPTMPSLTPQHRAEETAEHAFRDGMLSGLLALVPSSAAVYAAMQNKQFVRSTNWQSRTALIIMPPLFMFGFSSESKLRHRMEQMAHEADHSRSTAEWAEEHRERTIAEENARISQASSGLQRMHTSSVTTERTATDVDNLSSEDVERQLTELYNQSVQNSGVRIVPGDRLGPHHLLSNYWQENPFKILAGLGVPTILYIFKGRNDKAHLQLQSKLMHTRVYGQGVVIALLLGLMGVKGYLDSMGQYITEAEANARVEDMRQMRLQLKERLARDKRLMEERERVLRGKKENSEEQQTRERQLENIDNFEAQMEQEQEVDSDDDQPKSKKSKKKKKKPFNEPAIVIIDEDEAEKLVEDKSE